MAENFVIPKAFTKEWFGYVWDYYKYHIIVGIIAVVVIIFTVTEITGKIKYDANINYVSTDVIEIETSEKIAGDCAEIALDTNENDRVDISFTQLNFTEENTKDANLYIALNNRLMSTFMVEDEFIYIMDEKMMNEVLSLEATQGVFLFASDWADGITDGEVYGASLKDSTFLKKYGINTEKLYILVRINYKSDDKSLVARHENAKKIANFILK